MPTMKYLTSVVIVATLVALACMTAGCAPRDQRRSVLEERARWNVQLLSWIPVDESAVTLNIRVSGPPNPGIEKLTYRITLFDEAEQTLFDSWSTLDLTTIKRGGPKDLFTRVEFDPEQVAGVAVDVVYNPTPEEEGHIEELVF
jgi:hypothetical protein